MGIELPGPDRRTFPVDRPQLDGILPPELQGEAFEIPYEPRCRVCQKGPDVVSFVNSMLSQGYTYTDIHRAVGGINRLYPENRKISYNSIRGHHKNHLPYETAAIRKILDRRAEEYKEHMEEGQSLVLTPAAYAEVMMKKGFDTLIDKDTQVSPMEGLAASKILQGFIVDTKGDLDAATAMAQLGKIIEAVRAVVTPEQMGQIEEYLEREEAREIEAPREEIPEAVVVLDDEDEELEDEDL